MSPATASPVLTIEVERCSASEVTVRCHGRLVAGATHILYTPVRELIPNTRRIVLDLADLSHTDSMGLGTLARLYVAAKSAGCSLELMHLNKQIRNLLGITHMLDVFTVVGEKGIKWM
ncbi:MAG: STAS domain-containing protein [Acidobacteriaceae bacterium]